MMFQKNNLTLMHPHLKKHSRPTILLALTVLLPFMNVPSLSAGSFKSEWAGAVQDPKEPVAHLDPQAAFASFAEVAKWIDAWETPEEFALPNECVGVWVGLRWLGRLMGEYADGAPALTSSSSSRVLTGAVRKSMYRATARVQGVDGDAVARADRIERFHEIPCTLEIQFAHELQRLQGVLNITGIAEHIRPGIDGVLLRIKGQARALFPGSMLANEQMPAAALRALRIDLDLTEKQFDEQLVDGRIRVWKFSVLHLAQPSPNQIPAILHRGSQVVPAASINQRELEDFAVALATHLQQRIWPGEESLGIMGVYLADVDRYEQLSASGADQILAALALGRYANWQDAKSPEQAQKARAAAYRIIHDLVERSKVNVDPIQVAGLAALLVLAIDELRDTVEISPRILSVRTLCINLVQSTYLPGPQRFHDSVPPAAQAVCALVLGTREAVMAAWQNTPPNLQPSLLPWLGWAELKLAPNHQPIGAAAGLQSLRQRLWATQSSGATDPDFLGGLAFRGDQPPDWNTARPLAFLATMLGDPRLTDIQNPLQLNQEIVNVTNAIRFLRQLSIRAVDRYRLPNPERALSGIRSALWSDRQPVSASAMTLISLTEFCASLDAIKQQQKTTAAQRR